MYGYKTYNTVACLKLGMTYNMFKVRGGVNHNIGASLVQNQFNK